MKQVLYFSTTYCGPCKMFSPVVTEVCAAAGVPIQKIDAEENRELANQYSITGVPTLIILQDGQPVFRNTGILAKTKLIDLLTK